MLHPDSQFEILRSIREERLQEARLARQIQEAARTTDWLSLGDRLLLASGEFLIAFGTRMKRRVYPQCCGQHSAEARHVLS